MSEATTRDDLLRSVAGLLIERRGGAPLLVAIDGTDAAGKTHFADELAAVLRADGREVARASIDGFHHPASVRHARAESHPAESYYEDSFDYGTFTASVVAPLKAGGSRRILPAAFDHVTDQAVAADAIPVSDEAIVLVDGIFLGRPELRDAWDVWMYLDVEEAVALARGVRRDEDLIGPEPIARARYERRYRAGQRLYRDAVRPIEDADLVIDNTDLAAPFIVGSPGT